MANAKIKLISKFFGGITRDDKSKIPGSASNMEEIDIFSNADYFQAEQVVSNDSMPSTTEIYTYTAGSNGVVYGYGKETGGNKVRIVSIANGGTTNPGSFTTIYTEDDSTNLCYKHSPFQFFKETDNYLYYLTNATGTVKLFKMLVDTPGETEVGELSGITPNDTKTFMKVIFGQLFIGNGQFIARVDKDGVYEPEAFQLPNEWEAVDIIATSISAIILARPTAITSNYSKGFWWDLTSITHVDDSFTIPMGGPKWITNQKETIRMMCAINGEAKIYQLSGAFPGAIPIEIPGLSITDVSTETSTQFISGPNMVSTKDGILYFCLNKTTNPGIYALGQLDNDKPNALILSKRFSTTDYTKHSPNGLLIQGPNFYVSYDDNGAIKNARCESENSPARSSKAIYESIWIDDGSPSNNKDLKNVFITTYPLAASTDVDLYISSDYGSYTQYYRPDGSSMDDTNDILGFFKCTLSKKKVYKVKLALTSSTLYSPKITSIGLSIVSQDLPANL